MAFATSRAIGGLGIGVGIGIAIGFKTGSIGRWLVFGLMLGILIALVFSVRRRSS